MPDIILPTRVKSLTARRRSVDAPSAADVPTVNPAVARDPGLRVPSGAFGGGIGEGLEVPSARRCRAYPRICKGR